MIARLLYCLVFLTAALDAQESSERSRSDPPTLTRRKVSGIASSFDGTPWAGATIMLYSSLHPNSTSPAYTDMVRVKSDARGRFRAKILPGRPYSAWAYGEVDENGSYASSGIEDDVFPGISFRLKSYKTRSQQVQLSFTHRKDWKDYEPLRLEVLVRAKNQFRIPLELSADGKIVVPQIGGKTGTILVFGKNGLPILDKTVLVDTNVGKRPGAARKKLTLELPYPSKILVRVVYNPNGRRGVGPRGIPKENAELEPPIAGATISQRIKATHKMWYPLGQTDKDGFAELLVPVKRWQSGNNNITLQASSPGHSSISQYQNNLRPEKDRDIAKLRQENKPDITIRLMDGYKIKGKVLAVDGTPAAGLPLFLYYSTASSQQSWTHYSDPAVFTTKADGSFELNGVHVSCGFRLTAVLDKKNLAALDAGNSFPLHPVVVLAVAARSGEKDKDLDLGELHLAKMERLEIKVESEDGQPVAKAQMLLGEPTMYIHGKMGPYYPFRFSAGKRGRISILVNKSKNMVLVAASGGAMKVMELDFDKPPEAMLQGQAWSLDFVLDSGVLLRGRVMDSDGRSIARASVRIYRRSSRNVGSRLLSFLANVNTKTDENGRFDLWVQPNGSYDLSASIRVDGRSYRTQGQQTISLDGSGTQADEVELEIDIPKKR